MMDALHAAAPESRTLPHPPRLDQLDRRPLSYRFDPDADIPWDQLDVPGAHAGPHLLRCLGIRVDQFDDDEQTFELVQWAFGAVVAEAFVALETDVTDFVERAPPPSRSTELLTEEERKHTSVFLRYANHLRARRPALAATLDSVWRPPVSWADLAALASVDNDDQLQFLVWLATLFFEEYTVWIHQALQADGDLIQPTWLGLHACHRREELQHALTDAAHLDELPLDALTRARLARAFQSFLETHLDRLLCLDVLGDLVSTCRPGLQLLEADRSLAARPLLHELLHHPAFRFTRSFLPALSRMGDWPPRPAALLGGEPTSFEPPATMIGCLRRAIRANPHGSIIFVRPDGSERSWSYPELLARAERRLAGLQALGLKQGDVVLLVTPSPEELIPTWWACLLGGIIPAPLAPPTSLREADAEVDRLLAILQTLGEAPVLTEVNLAPSLRDLAAARGVELDLVIVSHLDAAPLSLLPAQLGPDDVAFLQFSSGSTARPRGVTLTHRNLIANARGMLAHRGGGLQDTFVSWLPLFHDMGIIGYHVTPIVAAARQVLLTPLHFMADPVSWLRALHRHGGTITGGPGFALARLLARLDPGDLDGLDLSRVHCWLVGAEPLSLTVLERAAEALATVGLPRTALCPGYGLAEATLAVTMTPSGEAPRGWRVGRDALGEGSLVEEASGELAVALVDCGTPIPGVEVRVVDAEHVQLPEDCVGHLQVRGATVTPGLHGEPDAPSPGHGWFETGDLGLVHDGRLYVTGRQKDTFFSGGRTLYAHDIEEVVAELDGVRAGGVALVIHPADALGHERRSLAIVPTSEAHLEALLDQVHRHVASRCGIGVDEVIAVERADLPRTTSGKLRRFRLGEHLRAGLLDHCPRLLPGAARTAVLPASDATIALVHQLWAEVLELEPAALGFDDDFHALGGHSLLAADIHARLEDRLGQHLSPAMLQHGATVREMAAWLDREASLKLVAATVPTAVEEVPDDAEAPPEQFASPVAPAEPAVAEAVEPSAEPAADPAPTQHLVPRAPWILSANLDEPELAAADRPTPLDAVLVPPPAAATEPAGPPAAEATEPSAEPEPDVLAEPEPDVLAEPEPDVLAEPEPDVLPEPEPDVLPEPPPPEDIPEPPPEDRPEPEHVAAAPAEPASPHPAPPIQIAVVALAVRFPGAADTAALWNLLARGADAFGPIPADRFDGDALLAEPVARRLTALRGAFLEDLTQFDPAPFGLRDEVARALDPQQRLLLEVCLDALGQAACHSPRVGVFAAAGDNEYALRYHDDPTLIGPHALLGSLRNVIASRVASTFGLTGPALTVDTACSSSLTAVHLACESLRSGACDLALAGGVQVNLTDRVWRSFASAGLLAPDGRCRPFDQDAHGLVPGEGAAIVLLKPLHKALEDGDEVWAVLRGSAVNNDGGALTGTVPSPAGQREVMRAAWQAAGCATATASYIEAHAAGTAIGDALEAASLAEVFADANDLPVGSVKSNLGHTFAVSGLAGLAKVLLALRHEQLPATLGCEQPSARAGFDRGPLRPLTAARPWPRGSEPRRAGIDAFGLGGTNVHLVVEEGPHQLPVEPAAHGPALYPLAGPRETLGRVADAHRGASGSRPARVRAAIRRAAWGATRHALVVPWDRPLDDALSLFRDGTLPQEPDPIRRLAFVLPGPGSQRPGMGQDLRRTEPAFASAWAHCRALLAAQEIDLDALAAQEDLDGIDTAQVVVFVHGYAAARWLDHLGVRPDVVIGHSAGEILAAHLAGVLELADALRLVVARGRAMVAAPAGGMIVAFAPQEQIADVLVAHDLPVDIAAHNAPNQTVLSGSEALIPRLLEAIESAGFAAGRLRVTTPAHSPAMAPVAEAFAAAMHGVPPRAASLPWISTRHGAVIELPTPEHWVDQVVEPVRFVEAVQTALDLGVDGFLELGATAGLTTCVEAIVGHRASALPLGARDQDEHLTALRAMAELWSSGLPVRLDRLACAQGGEASLPAWPWRRRRLWLDLPARVGPVVRTLRYDDLPCVQDHQTAGLTTAPAALLLDHLLREEAGPSVGLTQVVVRAPLAIGQGGLRRLRIDASPSGELVASSTSAVGDRGVVHLTAQRLRAPRRTFAQLDLTASRERCPTVVEPEAVYALLASSGFEVGPRMRSVVAVRVGEDEVVADLRTPPGSDRGRWLDPALLDGASHAVAACFVGRRASSRPFLGFTIGSLAVWGPVRGACVAIVQLRSQIEPSATVLRYDIWLTDPSGILLAEVRDVTAKRTEPAETVEADEADPAPRTMPALTMHPTPISPAPRPHRPVEPRPTPQAITATSTAREPLEQIVREVIGHRLRRPPDALPLDTGLTSLGLDSLKAVELVTILEARLEVALPATLLFEARTLREVLDHLRLATGGPR
jgi:acyl transferase domain-containing protein/acyl-CoA synthetase (AMP-forming)/AMP-acid ligase II/acyl carrier protein